MRSTFTFVKVLILAYCTTLLGGEPTISKLLILYTNSI